MKDDPRLNSKVQVGMKVRSHLRSGLFLPENLKYSQDDFWFNPTDGKLGLTDFSQLNRGDFSFVEFLVSPGAYVEVGTPIAKLESVKANTEIYAPFNGKVVATNAEMLQFTPDTINMDPYGNGWLFKFQGVDSSRLLDAGAYKRLIESYEW